MSKPGLLRRVLGALWNAVTWARLALGNILFLLVLALLLLVYLGGAPQPLPQQAALVLNPTGVVVDQKSPVAPLEALLAEPSPANHEVLVRDVIAAIELAAEDERINALVLELDYLVHVGISRTQEIVRALEVFSASGKPIVAVADYFTQDQYLLASYADEIIGHPLGGVALEGYGMYLNYYAEALDKLSVSMHVFRAGEHKSAVEPWLRNDMSAGEKEVALDWMGDLWRVYTGTVEANRGLASGAVDAYINGFAGRMLAGDGDAARDALEAGLLDQLLTRGEANDYLVDLVGASDESGLYQAVAFEEYLWRERGAPLPGEQRGPRVAVITAQGDMLPGEQPPGAIGGDSLAWLISDAAADPDIKAIVLRVVSPGGSLFASEVIREQVLAARARGKPVVVSMGAVAASGGYYIAAAADEIWATPTTITGSIGVYAAFPTVENLLARGGINTDGVGTTRLAGSLRPDRPLHPELKAALDAGVGHAYQLFLEVVAEGRGLPLERVAEIAEGRVWSAADALSLGLVDHLGGLGDAVDAAAARAGIEDYEIEYLEQPLSPGELFFQQLAERIGKLDLVSRADSVAVIGLLARPYLDAARVVAAMQDPKHLYLRCLACSGQY